MLVGCVALAGCGNEGGGAALDVGAAAFDGTITAASDAESTVHGELVDGSGPGDSGVQPHDVLAGDGGVYASADTFTTASDGLQGDGPQGDGEPSDSTQDGLGADGFDSDGTDSDGTDSDGTDSDGSDGDGPDSGAVDAVTASTPTDAPTSGGPLTVTLGGATPDGKGWIDWLSPLPVVTAIFGPQGSHHVWVSFCVPSSVGTFAKAKLTVTLQGSTAKIYPGPTVVTTSLKPLASDPSQRCRLALPGFVKCACTLRGQVLRMRVEVFKNSQVHGWAERSVQLVVPATSPCPWKGKMPCSLLPTP